MTEITSRQLRWLRFRRSGLLEPFSSPAQAAARLIGIQAQMPAAADLAFSNRTADSTPESLLAERAEARTMIRMWGQRNTVHIYDARDWPLLHTVLAEHQTVLRAKLKKVGLLAEFDRVVSRIRKRLENGDQLTYKDVKAKKLKEAQDRWVVSYAVFMQLVRDGIVCHGPDLDGQSTFVHRERWLPDLPWSPPELDEAGTEIARRYLAGYGPAQPADLAHWLGTRVSRVRPWLDSVPGCEIVTLGNETLWCLAEDLEELTATPPAPSRWPVRLLYHFDPLLLATKDKSWLVDDEHRRRVWRPAAHVTAVVMVGGRVAGTWRYDRKARGLVIRVEAFTEPSRSVAKAIERQAQKVAELLGRGILDLEIEVD